MKSSSARLGETELLLPRLLPIDLKFLFGIARELRWSTCFVLLSFAFLCDDSCERSLKGFSALSPDLPRPLRLETRFGACFTSGIIFMGDQSPSSKLSGQLCPLHDSDRF